MYIGNLAGLMSNTNFLFWKMLTSDCVSRRIELFVKRFLIFLDARASVSILYAAYALADPHPGFAAPHLPSLLLRIFLLGFSDGGSKALPELVSSSTCVSSVLAAFFASACFRIISLTFLSDIFLAKRLSLT